MRKPKQLEFESLQKPGYQFGGESLKGNARSKRPLHTKLPMHLTLRAVKGGMRNPKVFGRIHELIYSVAQKYGIKIYRYANVGNHIHILLRLFHHPQWAKFIRELTGAIALLMREIVEVPDGFWKHKPHTRIVGGWQKAFQIAKQYIYLNEIEAEGFINRRETKTLKDLRELLSG